jgi:vancomycin permeability regulator SanA
MIKTRKKLNWGTAVAQRKSDEKINENQRFRVRSPARVSFMKMKEIESFLLYGDNSKE